MPPESPELRVWVDRMVHPQLHSYEDWPDMVFAFHDRDEIGPRMLAWITKQTRLQSDDL